MKYDWKNGWNSIKTLLLAEVTVSIITGFAHRIFEIQLAGVVWFAVTIALLVLAAIAIFRNMTSRMFGAEGYLTHTLPVETWELLLGKAAGSWLFGIFTLAAAEICRILFMICDAGFSGPGESLLADIQALPKLASSHFEQMTVDGGFAALGIVAFLAISFLVVVQLQFACIAAKQFGKYQIAGGLIVFFLPCALEAIWNQTLFIGFLAFPVLAGASFAASHWLLKNRLDV